MSLETAEQIVQALNRILSIIALHTEKIAEFEERLEKLESAKEGPS